MQLGRHAEVVRHLTPNLAPQVASCPHVPFKLACSSTPLSSQPCCQVREEQLRVRPDPKARLNGEVLAEMPYTRQVWRCVAGQGMGCTVVAWQACQGP